MLDLGGGRQRVEVGNPHHRPHFSLGVGVMLSIFSGGAIQPGIETETRRTISTSSGSSTWRVPGDEENASRMAYAATQHLGHQAEGVTGAGAAHQLDHSFFDVCQRLGQVTVPSGGTRLGGRSAPARASLICTLGTSSTHGALLKADIQLRGS